MLQKLIIKSMSIIYLEKQVSPMYWNTLIHMKGFGVNSGFKKLNLEYIQPPLNINCAEDREYMLIVDSLMESKSISTEIVEKVVKEYFRFSFNINRPEMNKQYKEMFTSIKSKQIDIYE
jgi:hypothetical protein